MKINNRFNISRFIRLIETLLLIPILLWFMTFYVMTPTWSTIYESAIIPYQNKEITQDEAFKRGVEPFRNFMLRYTRESDLALLPIRSYNHREKEESYTFSLTHQYWLKRCMSWKHDF